MKTLKDLDKDKIDFNIFNGIIACFLEIRDNEKNWNGEGCKREDGSLDSCFHNECVEALYKFFPETKEIKGVWGEQKICDETSMIRIKDLKQMAIEWVKYFESKETDCEGCKLSKSQVYGNRGQSIDGETREDVIDWIKWFFNLTEDDIMETK